MTYAEAKAIQERLEGDVAKKSAIVEAMSEGKKGAMNLAPDHIKADPKYIAAKRDYDQAFAKLRDFNGKFIKQFKKEYTADRDEQRAKRLRTQAAPPKSPIKLPAKSAQKTKVKAAFEQACHSLQVVGFKEGPSTKTRIVNYTYAKSNVRAYLSIRYHPQDDHSTVLAEMFGRTTTQERGIGGEVHLIEVIPAQNNIVLFAGLDMISCYRQFNLLAKLMLGGVAIFNAMEKF